MKYVNIRSYEKSDEAKKYADKETRLVANRNIAKTAELGFKATDIEVGHDAELVLMVRVDEKVETKKTVKKIIEKMKTRGKK